MAEPVFKRILLKLSGEALMGDLDYGTDPQVVRQIARQIKGLHDRGVEVAVVGPTADVPASARLIVDGTLAIERGAVSIAIRVRNPLDGTVLDTLSTNAPSAVVASASEPVIVGYVNS